MSHFFDLSAHPLICALWLRSPLQSLLNLPEVGRLQRSGASRSQTLSDSASGTRNRLHTSAERRIASGKGNYPGSPASCRVNLSYDSACSKPPSPKMETNFFMPLLVGGNKLRVPSSGRFKDPGGYAGSFPRQTPMTPPKTQKPNNSRVEMLFPTHD